MSEKAPSIGNLQERLPMELDEWKGFILGRTALTLL